MAQHADGAAGGAGAGDARGRKAGGGVRGAPRGRQAGGWGRRGQRPGRRTPALDLAARPPRPSWGPSPRMRTGLRAAAAQMPGDSCARPRRSHLAPPAHVGTAPGTGGGSSACHLPCHPRGAAGTRPLQMRRAQGPSALPRRRAAPSDAPPPLQRHPARAICRPWSRARPGGRDPGASPAAPRARRAQHWASRRSPSWCCVTPPGRTRAWGEAGGGEGAEGGGPLTPRGAREEPPGSCSPEVSALGLLSPVQAPVRPPPVPLRPGCPVPHPPPCRQTPQVGP